MQQHKLGRHIGPGPKQGAQFAELCRLHARGCDTIDPTTYEELISAGLEPDQFRAMTDAEIVAVVGYCDLV